MAAFSKIFSKILLRFFDNSPILMTEIEKKERRIIMRIDAYNAINQIYQTNATSTAKKNSSTQSFSDKLEISQAAKSYNTAKSAVNNAPDVREDKIALIKSQLAAGTYNISSEAVADKILDDAGTISF
jgi:negative regulator of flagellin synthesis FlgM